MLAWVAKYGVYKDQCNYVKMQHGLPVPADGCLRRSETRPAAARWRRGGGNKLVVMHMSCIVFNLHSSAHGLRGSAPGSTCQRLGGWWGPTSPACQPLRP